MESKALYHYIVIIFPLYLNVIRVEGKDVVINFVREQMMIILYIICAKRMVTKRQFCYFEPAGRGIRALQGESFSVVDGLVEDCGLCSLQGWQKVCLSFPEILSDQLPTRVFIQPTSNLDKTCIAKLSQGTFFEFSKF